MSLLFEFSILVLGLDSWKQAKGKAGQAARSVNLPVSKSCLTVEKTKGVSV